jgi:hypothetical protein
LPRINYLKLIVVVSLLLWVVVVASYNKHKTLD